MRTILFLMLLLPGVASAGCYSVIQSFEEKEYCNRLDEMEADRKRSAKQMNELIEQERIQADALSAMRQRIDEEAAEQEDKEREEALYGWRNETPRRRPIYRPLR